MVNSKNVNVALSALERGERKSKSPISNFYTNRISDGNLLSSKYHQENCGTCSQNLGFIVFQHAAVVTWSRI